MKSSPLILGLALVFLAGCTTTKPVSKDSFAPETVMVTYHVKAGSEVQFEQLLRNLWQIYTENHMVRAKPHLILQDAEKGGVRVTEIFTWVSHDMPEQAPESVHTLWQQMHSFCESRDGHPALDGGEVQIVPTGK